MFELESLEDLGRCGTVSDLHRATSALTRNIGFDRFLYVVQVNTSVAHPFRFTLSSERPPWQAHHADPAHLEDHPAVLACIRDRRVIPLVWNATGLGTSDTESPGHDSFEHGVSVYVHGGRGEAAMLSLSSLRHTERVHRDPCTALGVIQLLGCYLHIAVQRLVLDRETDTARCCRLTPRERECLAWAAEGKTAWEIGNIIHVAERTVNFHISNATHKLGVNSRQHAVARAVSLGLLAL